MNLNTIRSVANAILYEGYMLYPYRPSALKNRSQGWTFGTLLPEAYSASHPGEPSNFSAQVVVVGEQAQFSAEFRFLELCGSESFERTVASALLEVSSLLSYPLEIHFAFDRDGIPDFLKGAVRIAAERVTDSAVKLAISFDNQSSPAISWNTRDHVLQQALVSAHAVISVAGGEFISLLSPPEDYAAAVSKCRQSGVFPVLAGDEGDRTAMLISPIILYDYPQIASNSHGDFFDGSEIDEMLTLRVLTLTDAEKEEVRANNERARALLERTESLSPEEILNLHGVLRDLSRTQE
ncbi:MAG TPA: hypothetical protein VFP59_02250 [Candidatus Angelobacter sp.]|nr:hypothetical protein [Candidatus Angelobacter sp.]